MATTVDAPVVTPPAADPAPLGLAGFALTTFLLSGVNAGLITATAGQADNSTWLGMALFYGGLAQFCAGMWEFRNRNTFGATAFSSFGAFWMGLAIMVVFNVVGHSPTIFGGQGAVWFLFIWGVFTLYMWVASWRTNGIIWTVFLLLWLTYAALWIGALSGSGNWTKIGGYIGILTAIAAFYGSFAGVVNSTFGRVVAPVFPIPGVGAPTR